MTESILVLEDDADIGELMRAVLTDAGYDVVVAGDGQTGLQRARERRPNAILVDILLPDGDGPSYVAQLRTLAGQTVPVLVVSGDDGARASAARIGARLVAKPFDVDALVAAVRDATAGG